MKTPHGMDPILWRENVKEDMPQTAPKPALKPVIEQKLTTAHLLGKIDSAKAAISEALRISEQVTMHPVEREAFVEWMGEAKTDLAEAISSLPRKGMM